MKPIMYIQVKGNIPGDPQFITELELRELVNNGTIPLKQDVLEKMLMSNDPVWTDDPANFFIVGVRKLGN